MANTATLTLRLDPEIKKSAEAVFGCFGPTLQQAINVFLYKVVAEIEAELRMEALEEREAA